MVAYVIVDTKIENPEEYEKYKALAGPLVEKYGGIYRARGGALTVIEDDLWRPTRIVLLEFPDVASAQAFMGSKDYAPVAAIRHANAKCTAIVVEGV
jgi:uncharacterized protein (DUF1330 family)